MVLRMSFFFLPGSCVSKSGPLDTCSSTRNRKGFWRLGTTTDNSVTFASCHNKTVFWSATDNKQFGFTTGEQNRLFFFFTALKWAEALCLLYYVPH